MASLTVKGGTPIECEDGMIEIEGSMVILSKKPEPGFITGELIYAYCLAPGESVRKTEDGKYVVEF